MVYHREPEVVMPQVDLDEPGTRERLGLPPLGEPIKVEVRMSNPETLLTVEVEGYTVEFRDFTRREARDANELETPENPLGMTDWVLTEVVTEITDPHGFAPVNPEELSFHTSQAIALAVLRPLPGNGRPGSNRRRSSRG